LSSAATPGRAVSPRNAPRVAFLSFLNHPYTFGSDGSCSVCSRAWQHDFFNFYSCHCGPSHLVERTADDGHCCCMFELQPRLCSATVALVRRAGNPQAAGCHAYYGALARLLFWKSFLRRGRRPGPSLMRTLNRRLLLARPGLLARNRPNWPALTVACGPPPLSRSPSPPLSLAGLRTSKAQVV
jgi:hypothetical protein